ncbi:MAG: DNA-directed RNA polymerase subunit omega [Firmicutes bacterium]|nr:DNA-directed RNA polymerase subunit omega [Bacillota bacterium]
MIYPSIDELMDKVDSKYTLVIATARRARMLNNGDPKLVETTALKDVSIALEEIAAGKIGYEHGKKQAE